MSKENVIVLGASPNPDRYSFMALNLLKDFGHNPVAVHPKYDKIEEFKVYKSLTEAKNALPSLETLTVYVNPQISSSMKDEILGLGMKRVIFNPGTENLDLIGELKAQGIEVVEGCTLVMLRTNQF